MGMTPKENKMSKYKKGLTDCGPCCGAYILDEPIKSPKLKTVYIASPYTIGDVGVNVRRQHSAYAKLMDAGFVPYAPLAISHYQHIIYPRHYEKWMVQDFQWIPICDIFLRLPGKSSGADREEALARKLKKPIYHSIKILIKEEANK
jgi:hypothetical protein